MYIQNLIITIVLCVIIYYLGLEVLTNLYEQYIYYQNTVCEDLYAVFFVSVLFNIISLFKYSEIELISILVILSIKSFMF